MTSHVQNLFLELRKYEKEGLDSNDFNEWGYEDINERILSKFSSEDWDCLLNNYQKTSDNFKSLITRLFDIDGEYTYIKLSILAKMMQEESSDVRFSALMKIVFLLENRLSLLESNHQMKDVLNDKFQNKAKKIASESATYFSKEITKALAILDGVKDVDL